MKRIIFMVLKLFYIAPIWFLKIWWYGRSDKYTEEKRFALLKYVTTRANKAGGVIIEPHGLENIPKDNGFILFPNHQGLFDVLAFLESCPRPFSIVMKKEVSDTFLVKQVRIILRGQSIDRDDLRQSLKVIMQMTEEVKAGRNYLIFAEGTRTRDKNNLLEFKGGSFKSAINAKCPIVPVAIIDSYKAFDTNSIKSVSVQVHYLKPLYYDEYKNMKSKEIADTVKSRIYENIQKFEKND